MRAFIRLRRSRWSWPWVAVHEEAVSSKSVTQGREVWKIISFERDLIFYCGPLALCIRLRPVSRFEHEQAEVISATEHERMIRLQQSNEQLARQRWEITHPRPLQQGHSYTPDRSDLYKIK